VCILGRGNFFVYSEQNLCSLAKIFGICTFGICEFLLLYSTTAVCVHFHFWQKIKSKTIKIIFCCCSTPLLLQCVHKVGTDGQTDRRTDGRTDGQADKQTDRRERRRERRREKAEAAGVSVAAANLKLYIINTSISLCQTANGHNLCVCA